MGEAVRRSEKCRKIYHTTNLARPDKLIPQENVHIVVDDKPPPIDVFLKDKTRIIM